MRQDDHMEGEVEAVGESNYQNTQLTLERAQDLLLLATQRAIETVSIGLIGLDAAGGDLSLPNARVKVSVTGPERPSAEAAADLRARVLGNGLRDCVDGIGVALLSAYRECQIWSQSGTVSMNEDGSLQLTASTTGAWWNETIVAGSEKFDRLTLPGKVERLQRLGLEPPTFTGHILSLNAARNCLTHRAGIVGPKDLRSPTDAGLEVTWTRLAITASDGKQVREIGPGSVVEAGEMVHLEVTPTSGMFALGERVTFNEDQFREIAQTFILYAQQVGGAILERGRRRLDSQEAAS
jgi:hypothetical protein